MYCMKSQQIGRGRAVQGSTANSGRFTKIGQNQQCQLARPTVIYFAKLELVGILKVIRLRNNFQPYRWTSQASRISEKMKKANVRFQKFFSPCFCIHSYSEIYFFQRLVLPTPFLSKNSRCEVIKLFFLPIGGLDVTYFNLHFTTLILIKESTCTVSSMRS